MHQILFHIPGTTIPVYGYGVMLVVGFIAGMYLAQFLARRSKLDPEIFANASILALVTGVMGARLSHVLENLPEYTKPGISAWQNFVNAVNIREGGLTYYGGFLLAFPSLVLYGLWKKVPLPKGMDIIAPCLMVGLAFGRIGCFLNGCCYGAACDARLGVAFPYLSDAYMTQFNRNELQAPVPRELIRDHCALGDYMNARPSKADQEFIREPLPNAVYGLINNDTLKKWDQLNQEVETARHDVLLAARDDAQKANSPDNPDAARERRKQAAAQLARAQRAIALAGQQRANPVHAAEIYSSVTAFLIAAFLLTYFTLPHIPGRVFAAMMLIEGVFRYVLEMLRVEPAVIGARTWTIEDFTKLLSGHLPSLPPQSYSMVVSFFLVIGGAVLWYVFGRIAGGAEGRGAVRAVAG